MVANLEDLPQKIKEKFLFLEKCLLSQQASSETLAAHVVLYKGLGMGRDLAIFCMLELSRRRSLGEEFSYEDFINNELKKITKIQPINSNLLKQLSSFFPRRGLNVSF